MNPTNRFLQNIGKARRLWTRVTAAVVLFFFSWSVHAEPGSVVLYRLTRCCPESAWTEAEYAVLKELDAMDVSVTLIDRQKDGEDDLESEIAAIGRAGDVAALLYFYKDRQKGVVGVRMAIFERSTEGVSPHQLLYTIKPSVGAVSIVTLKAVEAVREILMEPAEEPPLAVEPEKEPTPSPVPEPTPAPVEAEKSPPTPETEKTEATEPEQTRPPRGKIERKQRAPIPLIGGKRFDVGLGPLAVWSNGNTGASFALDAEAGVRMVGGLRFGLNVGATLVSKEFKDEMLGASYRLIWFQGALSWRFINDARVHPVFGVKGGLFLAVASGIQDNTYGNQTDVDPIWGVSGEGALAIDLTQSWGLVIDATAGALFPQVSIRLIYKEVAVIGRPLVNAGVRLEYRF